MGGESEGGGGERPFKIPFCYSMKGNKYKENFERCEWEAMD